MKEELHNSVQQLRIKKEITQEELAKILGVSRQTVIAIEKGNYIPSVMLAIKISKFFDQPVRKIFTIKSTT